MLYFFLGINSEVVPISLEFSPPGEEKLRLSTGEEYTVKKGARSRPCTLRAASKSNESNSYYI